MKFPREIDHGIPANLHENIVAYMCPGTTLTVQRVGRFARRAHDYHRVCLALEEGEGVRSRQTFEMMQV